MPDSMQDGVSTYIYIGNSPGKVEQQAGVLLFSW